MNNLELKVVEIDSLLNWIHQTLVNINEDSLDSDIEKLNLNINRYIYLKKDLKREFSEQAYTEYESSRIEITKQIKHKFDNIINKIQTEHDLVKSELANFQNQKKLTNYHR